MRSIRALTASGAGSAPRGSSTSASRYCPTGQARALASRQCIARPEWTRARRSDRPVANSNPHCNGEGSSVAAPQLSRFGSGNSVRRVEDDALLRPGTLRRQRAGRRPAPRVRALAPSSCAHLRGSALAPRRDARGCAFSPAAICATLAFSRFPTRPISSARRWHAHRDAASPCAGDRYRALCRRAVVAVIAATPHEARDAAGRPDRL